MKPKTVVTIILLLFVAASVAYLVVGERGGQTKSRDHSLRVRPDRSRS